MSGKLVLPSEPIAYRNGVYPHDSFRRSHRTLAMNVGGGVVVVLLIACMGVVAVGGVLGGAWMIRTFWDLLVRH